MGGLGLGWAQNSPGGILCSAPKTRPQYGGRRSPRMRQRLAGCPATCLVPFDAPWRARLEKLALKTQKLAFLEISGETLLTALPAMEIATPCGLCSERDAIPLRQYIEEGRAAAAAIAYTKYTRKKVAQAPGPAWITSYLENQLEHGLDTPICSACIAKHELKYSREVGSAGASEQLLCACGFWSCTNQKGLEVVDLGDERLLLHQAQARAEASKEESGIGRVRR